MTTTQTIEALVTDTNGRVRGRWPSRSSSTRACPAK